MKKKLVEKTEATNTLKKGYWITVQMVEDILVLNLYHNKKLYARHCLNLKNKEYATLKKNVWSATKIEGALGLEPDDYAYYLTCRADKCIKERFRMSKGDEQLIIEKVTPVVDACYRTKAIDLLMRVETEYGRSKRETTEYNRIARVNAMMAKVPKIPAGIKEWLNQRELGGMDYMTRNGNESYTCSKCGQECEPKDITKEDGTQKIRHKDMVICPKCGSVVQIIKRSKGVNVKTHFSMIQPIDTEVSVARHFTGYIECGEWHKKRIGITEDVRVILFKNPNKVQCSLYYEQYTVSNWIPDGGLFTGGCFDNKSNRANKQECTGFLYDGGIEEAFKDTAYEPWTRLFIQLSAAGQKLNYNRMMCAYENTNYMDMMEMLFRGRFFRLLREQSERVSVWNGGYFGDMSLDAESIEDVFGIADRQKINRIRDKNGGQNMVDWMRWSERHRQKISDKALTWLISNGIETDDMSWTECRFSIEQAMNYMERQRKESYPGKKIKQVISQYEDYMEMCRKLQKDTSDEMVYRPRELKRRHDEAVALIELQRAQIQADEYSQKYPEAEKVLGEIKSKFEYDGEEFFIMVPEKIVDVVVEGRVLHHCAGATDRYFDRIKSHETYICFCRKKSEPETPFYTIEVEPGGTIRQHRGMYDEEPDIEKVKPFLKEWQKEIRKRMTERDHELAAASRVKREENIAELKEKNNTRVLNGLMEDFMEAM